MFIVPFHTLVADMFEKMIPVRELAKQNFEYWLQKCDEDESAKNVLGASSLEQSGEKSDSTAPDIVGPKEKIPNASPEEDRNQNKHRLKTWLEHQRKHLPHLVLRKNADLDTADAIRSKMPGIIPNSKSYRHRRHKTGASRDPGSLESMSKRARYLSRRRSTGSARSIKLIMAELEMPTSDNGAT